MNQTSWSNLQDVLARQQEWGTDNFYNGQQIISPDKIAGMDNLEEYNQTEADGLAELLGQGIIRRGGNY